MPLSCSWQAHGIIHVDYRKWVADSDGYTHNMTDLSCMHNTCLVMTANQLNVPGRMRNSAHIPGQSTLTTCTEREHHASFIPPQSQTQTRTQNLVEVRGDSVEYSLNPTGSICNQRMPELQTDRENVGDTCNLQWNSRRTSCGRELHAHACVCIYGYGRMSGRWPGRW